MTDIKIQRKQAIVTECVPSEEKTLLVKFPTQGIMTCLDLVHNFVAIMSSLLISTAMIKRFIVGKCLHMKLIQGKNDLT